MIGFRIAAGVALAVTLWTATGITTVARANIIVSADDAGKANPDGRGSLLKVGPAFGLSAGDVTRIRATMGFVYCNPVQPSGLPRSIEASAFLAAPGVVVTVRHVFDEAIGRGGQAALATCYFRPQLAPYAEDDLVLKPGSFFFGDKKGGIYSDFAVARLATPIAGSAPLPLLSGSLTVETPLLKISGRESDTLGKVDLHEPVATICRVKKLWPQSGKLPLGNASAGVPTGIYSDCDTHRGASGGAILIWTGKGAARHLEIAALTVGTGDDTLDGHVYDAKGLSHTFQIVTDGAVRAAVDLLAGKGGQ